MADAGRAGGTKRPGHSAGEPKGGRSVDDQTHAKKDPEGDEEESSAEELATVAAAQDTSYAGTSTSQSERRGPNTGRKETNPEKGDARSGSTGSSEDGPKENEPDSIGSSIPTKRADGSERRRS